MILAILILAILINAILIQRPSKSRATKYQDLSDWDDESSQESVQWIEKPNKQPDGSASEDLEWCREIKSLRERIDRIKKQHNRDLEQQEKEAQKNAKKRRFAPQNSGTRIKKQVLHLAGGVLDAGLDSIQQRMLKSLGDTYSKATLRYKFFLVFILFYIFLGINTTIL